MILDSWNSWILEDDDWWCYFIFSTFLFFYTISNYLNLSTKYSWCLLRLLYISASLDLSFFLQFLQRFFSFSIDLLYKTSTLSLYSDSLRILSLTPFVNYILVWLCSCLNSNFSLRFFKFFNLASMSNIWLLVWLSWLLTWLFWSLKVQ